MIRTAVTAVTAAGLLVACGGPMAVVSDPRSQRVQIGPDVFHVLVEDDIATVSNFSTGLDLTLRVHEGAQAAVRQLSGCEIAQFVKFDAVNKWQARLKCPPTDQES